MALNVPGLVVMAVFYLIILGTGIWASMRSKKEERKCTGDGMEITLLAGRNINFLVGVFTLTGELLPALANNSRSSYNYYCSLLILSNRAGLLNNQQQPRIVCL